MLIRLPHKLSVETNLKQKCKEKNLHTKSQHTQNILRKKLHIKFYIQKYGRKKSNFILENILLHSPQRDRSLSTSKK